VLTLTEPVDALIVPDWLSVKYAPVAPVADAISAGEDPRRIEENWRDELERFQEIRRKYLIY